jgi:hypothetical protein
MIPIWTVTITYDGRDMGATVVRAKEASTALVKALRRFHQQYKTDPDHCDGIAATVRPNK